MLSSLSSLTPTARRSSQSTGKSPPTQNSKGTEGRRGVLGADEGGGGPEEVRLPPDGPWRARRRRHGDGLPPVAATAAAAAAAAAEGDAPALREAVFGGLEGEAREALTRVRLRQVVVVLRQAAVAQLRHPARVHLNDIEND
jgi:pyruvate/2-oxoglutarate dehydrogenase complex dihydrolipoamide acyltransferase (E2) component